MTDMVQMVEVRCRGCRRLLGLGPADFRIYCDEMCATDYPVAWPSANEDLYALIEARWQERDRFDPPLTKTGLGREFGVTRQWIEQILDRRDVAKAAALEV